MESPSANSNFSHFSKIVTNAKKATDRLLRRATSEIPERISTILHDCGFTSSQTTRASTSLFTIANDDDTQDRRPAAGAASGIG